MRKLAFSLITAIALLSAGYSIAQADISATVTFGGGYNSASLSPNPVITGNTLLVTALFGGINAVELVFDHCVSVTNLGVSGGTLPLYATYPGGAGCDGSHYKVIDININGLGILSLHIDSIIPNPGDPTNTPIPLITATPTPAPLPTQGILTPFGISGPNIYTRTPAPLIYPTVANCGLYNQCNLYSPPTALPAGAGGLFAFNLSDEVSIANNVIGVYKLANSQGAVNILMILFSVFGGIGLLFMLIKKAGK